ncbi:MAG TPA: hypothetical protein VIX84_21710 [Acidimicrobiales bacterium]
MSSTAPALDPRAGTPLAAVPPAAVPAGQRAHSLREPAYKAYLVLRSAFVAIAAIAPARLAAVFAPLLPFGSRSQ